MFLAKVVGNVVSSVKNPSLEGRKMMLVKQTDLDGNAKGEELMAIDTVCSGIGDTVIVVKEGSTAQMLLEDKKVPVHTVIVGVVDKITLDNRK